MFYFIKERRVAPQAEMKKKIAEMMEKLPFRQQRLLVRYACILTTHNKDAVGADVLNSREKMCAELRRTLRDAGERDTLMIGKMARIMLEIAQAQNINGWKSRR